MAILRFPGLPLIYFYNHRSADIFGSDVEVLVFFSLHMWLGGIAFAQVRTPFPMPFELPLRIREIFRVPKLLRFCQISR